MAALGRATSWPAGERSAEAAPRRERAAEPSMMAAVTRITEATGAPAMRIMSDAASLSFGPGRISFSDYVRLRLFDDAWWGGVDRRAVVGRRRARELQLQINGAGGGPWSNPLAVSAYLAAFGFPVPEVVAIYANDL